MQSVKFRSQVGSDGILHLELPVSVKDQEIEVMVIYQPLQPVAKKPTPEELGYPPNFFEETAGCLQDDPIQRWQQGEYEVREPLE